MVFAANPQEPWKKGVPSTEQPLPTQTAQFVDLVYPLLLHAMKEDDDKPTVSSACDTLAQCIQLLGPVSIEKCRCRKFPWHSNSSFLLDIPEAINIILGILNKKNVCQQSFEDEEQEQEQEEDGDEEGEMQLIECASDALVEIAKAAGENLQPFYKDIYQANLRYIVSFFHQTT